ncbi:unnamed protein product [Arctogadus glacialis]
MTGSSGSFVEKISLFSACCFIQKCAGSPRGTAWPGCVSCSTLKDQLCSCRKDVFYLSDFFGKMNEVSLKLQGDGVTHPFEGHHTQSSRKAGAVWKKFEQASV